MSVLLEIFSALKTSLIPKIPGYKSFCYIMLYTGICICICAGILERIISIAVNL